MDCIVIGGDARFECLTAALNREGFTARRLFAGNEDARTLIHAPMLLGAAERIVTNCPPRVRGARLTIEELLDLASPTATVYLCGPERPSGLRDPRLVNLWKDEELLRENARLTAEGALSAAMQAGRRCVRGSNCMVIGWGRIGSALTDMLVGLGAHVTVVSRDAQHRNRAIERGAEAVVPEDMREALQHIDVVFSTPPAPVLDAAALSAVKPTALVIDLASPPFGVDLHAAWKRGLRAWREPGLPGRYCPESAGQALLDAILRHERGL
jgi:hypothetical protein